MTGSTTQGTSDIVSDIDIAVFGDVSEVDIKTNEWFGSIGRYWVCLPLTTDEGYPTRLVIFDNGIKVDFSFWPLYELEKLQNNKILPDIYERGYKVLLDKDDLTLSIKPSSGQTTDKLNINEKIFIALIEEYWFEIWHVAKYLYRNDLWIAKWRDWGTKEMLLKIIEWYQKCKKGDYYDTRYMGVKMGKWADEEVWKQLFNCFGHFEADDSWKALFSSAKLFSRLAREIANIKGYTYPIDLESNILKFCKKLHSKKIS